MEIRKEILKKEVPDMAQCKQFMEEIVTLNAQLAERSHELELTNRELEAFNSTVSHDLLTRHWQLSTYTLKQP
ncbi:MAG: hypothetical protein NDI77_02310 [Geobacteraceae bacterium]|nr:hypothetical protein [Geobacteraceae bacterium]